MTESDQKKKLSPVKLILLCSLGVLVLAGIILAVLIGTRADVTLDALTESPNKTDFLFRYGVAQYTDEEEWRYDDTLTFEGIPLSGMFVFWDQEYADLFGAYSLHADGSNGQKLHDYIRQNCYFVRTGNTAVTDDGESFYTEYYTYQDARVEVTIWSTESVSVKIAP